MEYKLEAHIECMFPYCVIRIFFIIGTLGKEIISTRMIDKIVKYPSRLCNLASVFCNLPPSFEFLHPSLIAL